MAKQLLAPWLPVIGVFLGSLVLCRAEVLFFDNFSEEGNINGMSAPTSFNGAPWKSGSGPRTLISDGEVLAVDTSVAQLAVMELDEGYFEENPGLYALSVDVTFPEESEGGAMWVALGFNKGDDPGSSFNTPSGPNGASPWMLFRARGAGHVFEGRGVANYLADIPEEFPPGQTYNLKLVLNSRDEVWTLEAFIDDRQIQFGQERTDTHSFVKHPAIRYVGLSANPAGDSNGSQSVFATVDNFKLEKLEPGEKEAP
jgi:hypothetical protein